jgi:hypothetical protein
MGKQQSTKEFAVASFPEGGYASVDGFHNIAGLVIKPETSQIKAEKEFKANTTVFRMEK